jgi:hypothetical protein
VRSIAKLAKYYHKSPELISEDELRHSATGVSAVSAPAGAAGAAGCRTAVCVEYLHSLIGAYGIVYDDHGRFNVLPLLRVTGLESRVADEGS